MNDGKEVDFLKSYLGHGGGTQVFIFSQSLPDGQHGLEDKHFLNTGAQCLGPQQAGAGLP